MNFCMLRLVKKTVWLTGIVISCQSAFGFALLGPIPPAGSPDIYQTPALAYGLGTGTFNGGGAIVSALGGYAAPGNLTTGLGILRGLSDDMGTPKSPGE